MDNKKIRNRVLRKREVLQIVGIASSTLYDWLNPKSKRYDPTFPRQIKLGRLSVGWLSDEVEKWIETRGRVERGL